MKHISDRTMMPRAGKAFIVAAAAVVLGLGAPVAFAQPGGGQHSMHGGGSGELSIPKMIEQAKASLNLNTQQQAQWDNVVAQGKAARQAARTNRLQVKTALTNELAKAEPDLAAVAAVADSVDQQNRASRIAIRNQWLQLYASFSVEQKGTIRGVLQQRLQRMESNGAKMRERFQAKQPAAG